MYSDDDELEIYLDFGQLPYDSDMFSGQYLESVLSLYDFQNVALSSTIEFYNVTAHH